MPRSLPIVIRIKKGAQLATYCGNELTALEKFTEDDLSRVRQKRGELFARWESVQPGDVLELRFDPAALGLQAEGASVDKRRDR